MPSKDESKDDSPFLEEPTSLEKQRVGIAMLHLGSAALAHAHALSMSGDTEFSQHKLDEACMEYASAWYAFDAKLK